MSRHEQTVDAYNNAPENRHGFQRYTARILELAKLPKGWDAAGCPAITQIALDTAAQFIKLLPSASDVRYYIYPTLLGGLLFEFNVQAWDLSIEFLADGVTEFFGIMITNSEQEIFNSYAEVNETFIADLKTYISNCTE